MRGETGQLQPSRHANTAAHENPALVICAGTGIVGVAVAFAHLVQGRAVLLLVLLASIAWFASPVVAFILRRKVRGRLLDRWTVVVGAIASIAALANLTWFGCLQLLPGRGALTWNIDNRFLLNHAQTIARFADLHHALDYLGAEVHYHVGPAWIAGAVQYFTGRGLDSILFLWLPVMTAIVTFSGGALLCRRLGADANAAWLAAVLVPLVPGVFDWSNVLGSLTVQARQQQIFWLATQPQNSLLAWSVGIASLALLFSDRPRPLWLGTAGLASVAALKPQYFLGFGLVALAIATCEVAAAGEGRRHRLRRFSLALAGAGIGGVVMLAITGRGSPLGSPVLRPFHTGLALAPYRSTALVVAGAMFLVALLWRDGRALGVTRVASLLAAGTVALLVLLTIVQIPLREQALARALAIGLPWDASRNHESVGQADVPLIAVGLMFAIAFLATWAIRQWRAGGIVAVCVTTVLTAASPIPLFAATVRDPAGMFAHEPVQENGLLAVLHRAPVEDSVIVVSDLVDPAGDYSRPLRSPILTGYLGHQYVISNLEYYNFDQPDAANRLREHNRFFGSEHWSAWHDAFIRKYGVTHVLIHDRCPPRWRVWPDELVKVVSSQGWTLARVQPLSSRPADAGDSWNPPRPTYGVAPCLSGS